MALDKGKMASVLWLIMLDFSQVVAVVDQLVEHAHGKREVGGSIPPNGSRIKPKSLSPD